jgi:hypothetical protein
MSSLRSVGIIPPSTGNRSVAELGIANPERSISGCLRLRSPQLATTSYDNIC